jgi:hypothetical protein
LVFSTFLPADSRFGFSNSFGDKYQGFGLENEIGGKIGAFNRPILVKNGRVIPARIVAVVVVGQPVAVEVAQFIPLIG